VIEVTEAPTVLEVTEAPTVLAVTETPTLLEVAPVTTNLEVTEVVYTIAVSAPGPQGRPGFDGTAFDWTQVTPSASWSVTHGLGKYPSVTVNVDGSIVYPDVDYLDLNHISIVFPEPTAGSAHLV
jgi:hypothetical protein